jgi:hypothetical protein
MSNYNAQLQKTIQDARYSVALEFCGQSQAKYVLRFCDNITKVCDTLNDAILEAIFHQDDRELKLLAIE